MVTKEKKINNMTELQKATCKELYSLCKEYGIKNYSRKNKTQLIAELSEMMFDPTLVDDKMQRIERAEEGLLIAFWATVRQKKLLLTGKIVENCRERHECLVENKNSKRFIVPYEDISWVRTGRRWPNGIFEILKNQE